MRHDVKAEGGKLRHEDEDGKSLSNDADSLSQDFETTDAVCGIYGDCCDHDNIELKGILDVINDFLLTYDS